MNSHASLLDSDSLVSHANEFADHGEWRASSVIEDHVDMLDSQRFEVGRGVEVRVQSDDQADIALREVGEHILEGLGQKRVSFDGGHVPGEQRVQLRALGNLGYRRVLRRGKSKKVGSDPVEVAVLDALIHLILVQVEVIQVAALLLLGLPNTIYHILDADAVVGLAVASISEGHQRGINLSNWGQGQMRRPVLNQNHVAGQHASSICAT